jgi:hypothetical protein
MNNNTTTAQHLAAAAIAIAQTNHYMVGFDAAAIADATFDDFTAAHTILVDWENDAAPELTAAHADLAFTVLDAACFKAHRAYLSR